MQFYSNITAVGVPLPFASGDTVTRTVPFPATGGFVMTVAYSGDATFSPSTALGVALAVLGFPSITALSTASATILLNSSQAFAATVFPGVGATGTPTGLVEFVRGGSLVATVL